MNSPPTYRIAKQGVFLSVQGEGAMMGTPMIFIRLAGCNVGCPECDTDYSLHQELTKYDVCRLCLEYGLNSEWIWITGGEPTDQMISPLASLMRTYQFRVAIATNGTRLLPKGHYDFISVSPHSLDGWKQRRGNQLNIVPGLNGLKLSDIESVDTSGFEHKFVTPMNRSGLDEAINFVYRHHGWRLGVQAHKTWSIA